MTFTYTGDLATDLDEIRFRVGDTVSGSGVRPSGGNFTDEEIAGLLTLEGSVPRTIAGIYERLSSEWARYVNTQVGSRREELKAVAESYYRLAKQWRDDYGQAGSSGIVIGLLDSDISQNDPDTSS